MGDQGIYEEGSLEYDQNNSTDNQEVDLKLRKAGKYWQIIDQYNNIYSYHASNEDAELTLTAMKAPPPGHPFYGNQWIQFRNWGRGSFGDLSLYTNTRRQLEPGQRVPQTPLQSITTPFGRSLDDTSPGEVTNPGGMGMLFTAQAQGTASGQPGNSIIARGIDEGITPGARNPGMSPMDPNDVGYGLVRLGGQNLPGAQVTPQNPVSTRNPATPPPSPTPPPLPWEVTPTEPLPTVARPSATRPSATQPTSIAQPGSTTENGLPRLSFVNTPGYGESFSPNTKKLSPMKIGKDADGKDIYADPQGWSTHDTALKGGQAFNARFGAGQKEAIERELKNMGAADGMTAESLVNIWENAQYGSNKVTIKINQTSANRNFIALSGSFYDQAGNNIGSFNRSISPHQGMLHVHNGFALINENVQGGGLGAHLYSTQEDRFRFMGVKAVTVHANINVGGYEWAKCGFTNDSSSAPNYWKANAEVLWNQRNAKYGTNHPFPKLKANYNMWDIAGIKHPNDDGRSKIPGERNIGKDLLLGKSWYGTKLLNSTDEGMLSGIKYYQEKGVK